ncbi:MAG: hypothetical protein A3D65_05805 [Candidatus Lloydbacteria bacterium RIFCSPHIGHO2_02_FULL_50_13]|uniref:Uncharacterized protein n=1 Tax=Candidatus Lloydbacteria bacterium RIFCSPHIGHO2_02_FULL_50_13 TaxID=1798661 RepID=A0A1G2DAK9_9BACT|nr:MAG: hypothetical protein A3D65_05805 [Candidatus Lloydbacteria bacterium RIFCSPHIGHO2_02_FULL_50_13]
MNTAKEHTPASILAALIVAGALVGGAVAFAQGDFERGDDTGGEQQALAGIMFPVAELGNCASRDECHAYCDVGANMNQCIAFAKAHGLMNKEEAERSEKFSRRLEEGKTPGGCNSPGNCKAYCEDIAHIDECVQFAEAQGFKGEEFARGKKLGAYLKKGGLMPGGCTSRASCDAYCSDFSRAEECYRFAEAAGVGDDMGNALSKHGGPAQKVSPEHLKKLGELAKRGETPGGCTNKDACMAYCEASGHMEECVTFGEKVGFMKKEDADRARKFMNKGGPGGCTSRESCDAFCNDPANQETCFTFAEENGLIPPEELKRMKEGWVRMRQGLENAPSEVKECLTSALGATVIEDIQSGKLTPGPQIGERVRGCFEKFGGDHRPQKIFFDAPDEVKTCLKEKLGEEYEGIRSGKIPPTPEMADVFRVCFQQVEFERSNGWGGEQMRGEGGGGFRGNGGGEGGMGPNPEMFKQFLRSAPPEIQACLKEKLGERFEKIASGELMPGPEMGETMRSCFENFRPMGSGMGEGMNGGMQGGMDGRMPPLENGGNTSPFHEGSLPPPGAVPPETQMMNFMSQFSSGIAGCLREKLGEEGFIKIAIEGRTPELESAIRSCSEQLQTQSGFLPPPPTTYPAQSGTLPAMEAWTSKLPDPIQHCLKEKFGAEYEQLGFRPPSPDIELAIRACYGEVSGGNIIVAPFEPVPIDGTVAPLEEPSRLQSRIHSLRQHLLGAALAPFVVAWHIFR